MKQKYVTKTKLKKLDDNNVKFFVTENKFLNPNWMQGQRAPDINTIMDRLCPNDTKNI